MEALLHGEENAPYLMREEWRLKDEALKTVKKDTERPVPPTVRSLMCNDCDHAYQGAGMHVISQSASDRE